MNLKSYSIALLTVFILIGCSRSDKDEKLTTHISGQITVDNELDSSGDYSGIELIVSFQDEMGELSDTLFYAVTDSMGYYSGTARYDQRDIYPVVILRNRNTFGVQNMVFADGDSITFNAMIPNVSETASIQSYENDVFRTLQRVERGFTRVAQFINAGAISQDSINIELENWTNLFWEVYENYPGTFAGIQAGNASVSIASNWNDSLMVARSEQVLESNRFLRTSARMAMVEYYAETEGLNSALAYLDRLESIAIAENELMNIQIDRIELMYDSSLTVQANAELDRFIENFSDNRAAKEWADSKKYDLEFLSPGSEFPEFAFETVTGDSVSSTSLLGKPYLLEISRLDNFLYQQQYDRTVAIHQIYSNFGLEIVTIPLAANLVSIEAFYTERGLHWDVADPNSFNAEEIIDTFNVNQVPTRFLVNTRGELIRRYIGNEYDEIVRGLQQITN